MHRLPWSSVSILRHEEKRPISELALTVPEKSADTSRSGRIIGAGGRIMTSPSEMPLEIVGRRGYPPKGRNPEETASVPCRLLLHPQFHKY